MLRKISIVLFLLLFAVPAMAHNENTDLHIEFGYDYLITPNPDLNTHEDGWGGHVRVITPIQNSLYGFLELGHMTDIAYTSGTDALGELRAYTGLLGVMLKPKTNFSMKPYVFAGAGVGWWDFKESAFLQDEGIVIETDISFISKVGGGVMLIVDDLWSISIESGWFQSRVPVECTDDGVACGLPDDDPTGVEFIPVSVKGSYKF